MHFSSFTPMKIFSAPDRWRDAERGCRPLNRPAVLDDRGLDDSRGSPNDRGARAGQAWRERRERCRRSTPTVSRSPISTRAPAKPVLLIHGFASNVATNWVDTELDQDPDRRPATASSPTTTAAMDTAKSCTGSKTTARRSWRRMRAGCSTTSGRARARHRLLDGRAHRGFPRLGASGARAQPRVRRSRHQHGARRRRHRSGCACAGAASIDEVTNPTARTFRAFAEQTKSDLKALAACIRSARAPITAEALGTLRCRCWSSSERGTSSAARRPVLPP